MMRTERQLFLVLGITPKSKVCAQWKILKPPVACYCLLGGDFGVILTFCYLIQGFHVVFCFLLLVIYM